MDIIDGNRVAADIIAELKAEVATIAGRRPCLALVRVGDDPASVSYVRKKEQTAAEIGVEGRVFLPPVSITQQEIFALIDQLNADPAVDGILVQSPLPAHLDELAVFRRVSPEKDVDGFHTVNLGKVAQEDPTGFVACTPAGIMELLRRSGVDLKGKHVVVLGRSLIVGKPVALLALQKRAGANGTVTVCHSATRDLPAITRLADVLIAAIGRPEFVTAEMVKPVPQDPVMRECVDQVWAMLAEPARSLAIEGVRRMADYQDPAYAQLYVARLRRLHALLAQDPLDLMAALARHLALWMSYEDTVRVADLKTRGTRFSRVREEVHAQADQLLRINEYMHPRFQEVCETLPAGLGAWLWASPTCRRWGERWLSHGRVVQTNSLGGFFLLYAVSAFKPWRRGTLRYRLENQRIEQWLGLVCQWAPTHPALALETVWCQRLIKGYSDTHARGHQHHDRLLALVAQHGALLSAEQLRDLREAALADEHGKAFHSTLAAQGWA